MNNLSEATIHAEIDLARAPKSHRALYRTSLQNCVAHDVQAGLITKEDAAVYLQSRRCYGPKGKAILKACA